MFEIEKGPKQVRNIHGDQVFDVYSFFVVGGTSSSLIFGIRSREGGIILFLGLQSLKTLAWELYSVTNGKTDFELHPYQGVTQELFPQHPLFLFIRSAEAYLSYSLASLSLCGFMKIYEIR